MRRIGIGPMVSVRKTYDVGLVKLLQKEILPDDYFNHQEENQYWIAYYGEEVAGFCVAKNIKRGIVFLSLSGVLPEFRGKGIQTRMIKVRLWWARKIKANYAITYTMKDNFASSNNLIKCDFALYDPEYAWVGREMLYWIKKIPKGNDI